MVSLTELHCSSPQALDPLVQVLVQDHQFISAVRDGALHSAAIAAVRLLKPHLGSSEFKRPPDRRTPIQDGDGLEGHPTPRHAATSPAAPPPASVAAQRGTPDPRVRELLRSVGQEALQIEDLIPWNSVRRTWRNRRASWRRQVKGGELVPDLALRLKELRAALLTDEPGCFSGCGQTWRVQLDACIHGRGSHHSLASVWEELKASIKAWLDIRDKADMAAALATAPGTAVQLSSGAMRAVQAMAAAAAAGGGGEGGGDSALLQVPLEAILNHSREGLAAVQQAIDYERRVALAQQQAAAAATPTAAGSSGAAPAEADGGQPLVSYFSSINAGWEDSELDSGAPDSDYCGSDATDLDSDFD